MELHQLREQLIALHLSNQKYSLAHLGWHYLSAVPNDPDIVRYVVESLIELGLGGPAQELIRQRRDVSMDDPGTSTLLKSALEAPSGRIAWHALKPNFESNLEALLKQNPHLSRSRSQLQHGLSGYQLFQTKEGCFLLSRRRAGRYREWLPNITDYSAEKDATFPCDNLATLAIMDGLSLGPMTDMLYAHTVNIGDARSLAMYIIEPGLSFLAAWLHMSDHTRLLSDPRVRVYSGPEAIGDFESHLLSQDDIPTAAALIVTPPGRCSLSQDIKNVCQHADAHQRKEYDETVERLRQRHKHHDSAYWYQRLAKPKLVMGLASRFTTMLQHSTRDIGSAIKDMGLAFQLIMEANPYGRHIPMRLGRIIEQLDPDLVVMVDHLRYEYGALFQSIPVLSWIQDPMPHLLCRAAGTSIGETDFVCGYYRKKCTEKFGYPERQFVSAAVPVSENKFFEEPLNDRDRQEWACDMVYVGHMPFTLETYRNEWRGDDQTHLQPLYDNIYEIVLYHLEQGIHLTHPETLVTKTARAMGASLSEDDVLKLSRYFMYRLFDIGYRLQTLSWAARWARKYNRSLRLYGNGWENHPEFAPFARGPIEHGMDLRKAYRGATLAIQTIPLSILHQRTFEALLSGSLVLARFSPHNFARQDQQETQSSADQPRHTADAIFPQLNEILFKDADHFEERSEYFLSHPEPRHTLLKQFQTIVQERYTYRAIVPPILKRMREAIGEFA